MKLLIVILLFMVPGQALSQDPEPAESTPSNQELYESGIQFGLFLDQAERRRAMWLGNFEKGNVPKDILRRASELHGPFYLISVAIDGCSDSVNTIPYLAHLANSAEAIEMRIVSPDAGRHIMEAHPTPDGRASTPTVLVLDSDFKEIGAFIERPKQLQDWALGSGKELSSSAFMTAKFAWYDDDLGRQTMSEVLDIIEKHQAEGGHDH